MTDREGIFGQSEGGTMVYKSWKLHGHCEVHIYDRFAMARRSNAGSFRIPSNLKANGTHRMHIFIPQ